MKGAGISIASAAILGGMAGLAYWYLVARKKETTMATTTTTQPEPFNAGSGTRGYRNNNPLNIRISSANNWEGKVLPNTDGVFEQFRTMAYGYRAALLLIRNYILAGHNTVAKIISRWAPANENNTTAYINAVCSKTGFAPTTTIGAYNEDMMVKLVYAMAIVENGSTPLPVVADIREGWKLL